MNRSSPHAGGIARCDEVLGLPGVGRPGDPPVESLTSARPGWSTGPGVGDRADVLLLDEPSSGLDGRETAGLGDTLRAVVDERGVGIVLVEHDISLVEGFSERPSCSTSVGASPRGRRPTWRHRPVYGGPTSANAWPQAS